MTAKEIQKRNAKAEQLRVIQIDDTCFYVESSEGKICYKVLFDGSTGRCTCADYARNSKQDPHFACKHILAVTNAIPEGKIREATFLDKRKPKLDERFVRTIEGRDFVLYAGLLDLAHQKGLLKIEVEPIQYPSKDNGNMAICRAVAISKTGESFSDVGDANPTNCNSKVAKHLLRMASTRAKARALRDLTNIGMTCLEELEDFNDIIGDNPESKTNKRKRTAKKKEASKPSKTEPEPQKKSVPKGSEEKKKENQSSTQPQDSPKMSEAQKRAIYNLARRRGISVEELEQMCLEAYGVSLDYLTATDASSFIRNLQQAA